MANFTPIPVTRASTVTRAHADITAGVNKSGDLVLILSPEFFGKLPAFAVGGKVVTSYDAAEKKLLIEPSKAGTMGARALRKRHGFPGAATLLITKNNLPNGMPLPEKRTALLWDHYHALTAAVVVSMEG